MPTPEVKWICYKKLWINNLYDEYQWIQQIEPAYSAILWHFILRQLVTKSKGQSGTQLSSSATPNTVGGTGDHAKRNSIFLLLSRRTRFERLLGHRSENGLARAPLVLKHTLISHTRETSIKNYVTSPDFTASDGAKVKMRNLMPPPFCVCVCIKVSYIL